MKLIFLLAAVYLEIRICNKTSIFLFWDATFLDPKSYWDESHNHQEHACLPPQEVWNEQAAPLLISGSAYCDQAFPLKEFRPGQTFCKQVGGCRSFSSPPSNMFGSHTTKPPHTHTSPTHESRRVLKPTDRPPNPPSPLPRNHFPSSRLRLAVCLSVGITARLTMMIWLQ